MCAHSSKEFLFRCESCKMIVSLELEEGEMDLINEDQMFLECQCGEMSLPLRN